MAITGFWNRFSFVGNVSKMRKALVEFLTDEGIKCEIKDGGVVCEYKDGIYTINFGTNGDYAECVIVYELGDDSYTALDLAEKTFIADKANISADNHAVVYAYNESIKVWSTFYFTSKSMMLELFVKHFDELNECLGVALEVANEIMQGDAEEGEEKPKQIGFCVPEQNEKANGNDVAAVAKK